MILLSTTFLLTGLQKERLMIAHKKTSQRKSTQHLWHPCSQMKDQETFPPLKVASASGSYLTLNDGRKIIDGIASWWCKSLGHNHPQLKQALVNQANRFEHVILANTTNNTIEALSEKLSELAPTLNKALYASDGSCAIEMAMKMSLHSRQIQGDTQRCEFLCLENAYHGETCATLSVSDLGLYKEPYKPLLMDYPVLRNIPYVAHDQDPLWFDAETHWQQTLPRLEPLQHRLTAILVEPIAQGAGGMRIYSADFLRRLVIWAQSHKIHIIADEIMTGLWRTGKKLACEHANITADFLCLSKGLTSGWLPLSVMLTSQNMYDCFYGDYGTGRDFLHSHTHSGNALAAAVALEALTIMQDMTAQVQQLQSQLLQAMGEVSQATGKLSNLRGIGGIVAADLAPHPDKPRIGFAVAQKAAELGALIRPLGSSLYWFPPLNIPHDTLKELQQITTQAIQQAYQ